MTESRAPAPTEWGENARRGAVGGPAARRPAVRPRRCCVTATPATSSTHTGTGPARRSSPTSTAAGIRCTSRSRTSATTPTSARVVRTANAFAVDTVHIVGRRRWNRRGAMVTDRYQRLRHHDTTAELLAFAADAGLTVVAVDNVPGAVRLERHRAAARLPADLRPGGPRHHRRREGGRRLDGVDRPVRIDPQHQRRRRRGIAMHTWITSTWRHFPRLVGQDQQPWIRYGPTARPARKPRSPSDT